MLTLSPEFSFLLQFIHPDKTLGALPNLDESLFAGLFNLDVAAYREYRAAFDQNARQAAESLLADPAFAARVDLLPFTTDDIIVGLGDSITDDLQSWLTILRHVLELRRPQDRIRLVNHGVSGDTTAQMIARFLTVTLEQPHWIIMMAGTNDARRHGLSATATLVSLEETRRNLNMLRHFASAQTGARLVWITPATVIPEQISAHWLLGANQVLWHNADLAAIAAAVRALPDPVVDLQPVFGVPANPDYLLDDGLHPSLAGQTAIVRALVERLT